jgi:hypothetical protein
MLTMVPTVPSRDAGGAVCIRTLISQISNSPIEEAGRLPLLFRVLATISGRAKLAANST